MTKKKITVLNHYDILQKENGGAQAIKGLYYNLSKHFNIDIITFGSYAYYPEIVKLTDRISVIPIDVSNDVENQVKEICKKYEDSDPTVAISHCYSKCQYFIDTVRKRSYESIVVIVDHPYTWKLVKKACPDKHLWYRAHNVEFDFKKSVYEGKCKEKFLKKIYDIEDECCRECEKILTITAEDANRFSNLYKCLKEDANKVVCIGAGYDEYSNIIATFPNNRRKETISHSYTGLLISSGNKTARDAVNLCLSVARLCDDVKFVICGSVGEAYKKEELPHNVSMTGYITRKEKDNYLATCDFALNLVTSGSGLNIKMLEYFLHGIPVISTLFGLRGINATDEVECLITEPEEVEIVKTIKKYRDMATKEKDAMAQNAISLLKRDHTWKRSAKILAKEIQEMYWTEIDEDGDFLKYKFPFGECDLKECFLPQKAVYIRCAGEYGIRCAQYLRKRGIEVL